MKLLSKLALIVMLSVFASAYEPPLEAVKVNGVTIHVLADDIEEGVSDGMIDQFWLTDILNSNKPLPKNLHIVDVRKTEKYKTQHIKGAISIPYDKDAEKIDVSKFPKDGIVVFYCNTGLMSIDARTSLDEELAKRVFVFDVTYKCDKDNKNCKINPNEAM